MRGLAHLLALPAPDLEIVRNEVRSMIAALVSIPERSSRLRFARFALLSSVRRGESGATYYVTDQSLFVWAMDELAELEATDA